MVPSPLDRGLDDVVDVSIALFARFAGNDGIGDLLSMWS